MVNGGESLSDSDQNGLRLWGSAPACWVWWRWSLWPARCGEVPGVCCGPTIGGLGVRLSSIAPGVMAGALWGYSLQVQETWVPCGVGSCTFCDVSHWNMHGSRLVKKGFGCIWLSSLKEVMVIRTEMMAFCEEMSVVNVWGCSDSWPRFFPSLMRVLGQFEKPLVEFMLLTMAMGKAGQFFVAWGNYLHRMLVVTTATTWETKRSQLPAQRRSATLFIDLLQTASVFERGGMLNSWLWVKQLL